MTEPISPDLTKQVAPFVVGALGALTYALRFMPGSGWIERVVNVLSGALVAGFTAPVLLEWQKLTTPAYAMGAAFLIGLLGMSLVAAVLDGIKDTKLGQIVTGWISRKGGAQ